MQASDNLDKPWLDLDALDCPGGVLLHLGTDPDADRVASGYALYRFFERRRVQAELRHGGGPVTDPGVLEMLRLLDIPLKPGDPGRDGVQCRMDIGREGSGGSSGEGIRIAISHRPVPGEPPEQSEIRPYLSSTSTIVWQLLLKAGCRIEKNVASCLLYGLHSATNGFTEIRFPLDRDMIDGLEINRPLFDSLCRKHFLERDLAVAARALNGLECRIASPFVLLNVLPCDPGILRFIGDFALQVHGVDLALVYAESGEGTRFVLRSGSREHAAPELVARLLAGGIGSGGGAGGKGGGFIHAGLYEDRHGGRAYSEYFHDVVREYLGAYDIFDCTDDGPVPGGVMRSYQKLPVMQGFIRCSEVFPKRTRLHVRMLEGDIVISAAPGVYLMIGIAGEVYPIRKKDFQRRYTTMDQPFQPRCVYEPAVLDANDGSRVPLLPKATACLSKERRVLARQLERGVKLFTGWDGERYVRGEPGDWLVRSRDDEKDWYIVTGSMFPLLYERVQGKMGN